jgi:hypothetical protein
MSQHVIQDFLNLPGITGIALINEHSRALFYQFDCALEAQQKEDLIYSILQVLETIPEKIESLQFKFSQQQAYLYQLNSGLVLLVLADKRLIKADYLIQLRRLKPILESQATDAIAQFQRITTKVNPLKSKSTLQGEIDAGISPSGKPPTLSNKPPTISAFDISAIDNAFNTNANSTFNASGFDTSASTLPTTSSVSTTSNSQPRARSEATLQDLIIALNRLNQLTAQDLGIQVIVNYWKTSRPADEWLAQFEIDRSAQFNLPNATAKQLQKPISAEEQAQIQAWVFAFISRCSQVLRNFSTTVQQNGLTDEQKSLLLGIKVKGEG